MKDIVIKDGIKNTPPRLSDNARLAMEATKIGQNVNQFIMIAILAKVLGAVDDESPIEKLIFNITHLIFRDCPSKNCNPTFLVAIGDIVCLG
jgi:hypothetical protein